MTQPDAAKLNVSSLRTPNAALDALRWEWDVAYDISVDEDGWHARRGDGKGSVMTASTPDELRRQIIEDYQFKRVQRSGQ
jgi:hypothetical protein